MNVLSNRIALGLVLCTLISTGAQSQASTVTGLSPAIDISSITPFSAGGYYLFATGPADGGRYGVNIGTDISRLPSYVSTFNLPTDHEASGYGYASVGTPLDGVVTTGTITDGSNADKFSFVVGALGSSVVHRRSAGR